MSNHIYNSFPLERAFQISKRDTSCDCSCSGGIDSLYCRAEHSENCTAATGSQPRDPGNVTLPLSFCVSNKNGVDKLASKVLLTMVPSFRVFYVHINPTLCTTTPNIRQCLCVRELNSNFLKLFSFNGLSLKNS